MWAFGGAAVGAHDGCDWSVCTNGCPWASREVILSYVPQPRKNEEQGTGAMAHVAVKI
jgi:hypothetical protein